METQRILVVDDDETVLRALQDQLRSLGFQTDTTRDGAGADRLIRSSIYAAVLLDLRLPDSDGITLLERWKRAEYDCPVIIISGMGTIPETVKALKLGAEDFLEKPIELELLEFVLTRILKSSRLQSENGRLKNLVSRRDQPFLGVSEAVRSLAEDAGRMAVSDQPILIEGETGTGKQVLAHSIHHHSPRRNEPFVRMNCAAVAPTLFESELFGHVKGAFTGAYESRPGRLELAGSGTLFLDEIGELPGECQAKMLSAIEDRVFERVGGTKPYYFTTRVIAATNRDLEREVGAGTFRRDLFYRLNALRLRIPPLHQRREDIPSMLNTI